MKAHPCVVVSPIRWDTIWCCPNPTPDDQRQMERKNKLLCSISVRQLYKDLFKPKIGLPEIVFKDGVSQLSVIVLKEIMLPKVKKMSKFLKEYLLLL